MLLFVEASSIFDAKTPVMHSATYNVAFYVAKGQRGAGMRTTVIDSKELTVDVKDANRRVLDDEHSSFTAWDFSDVAHCSELGFVIH